LRARRKDTTNRNARKLGFEPDRDLGQRYILMMLD
jgi:hypothetical protein